MHWENVLVQMNESKSQILDVFASEFGNDIVFGNAPFNPNDLDIKTIFGILNEYLFEPRLQYIPVKYLEYQSICNDVRTIFNKYKQADDKDYELPPKTIYGMHFAIVLNVEFSYSEPLIFADEEIIYLNKSILNGKSFSLHVSSLCHEMIHYYDRLYGEYQNRYKVYFITGEDPKLHDSPTFNQKMNDANNNYIKVVKNIPSGQTVDTSNTDAVTLAIAALEESETKKPCTLSSNTPNVQLVGNRRYIVIQDFD